MGIKRQKGTRKTESSSTMNPSQGDSPTDSKFETTSSPADASGSRGGFAGNVLILAGGTAIAQGLSILVAPVLTRLYAPAAFGLAALFSSITGILAVFTSLRYEMSIMLPRQDEDAANLVAVSLGSVLLLSGLSAIVILVVADPLLTLLKAGDLKPYLWLMPIATMLGGTFATLSFWNSRKKRFGRVSTATVAQSVVTNASQVGLSVSGFDSAGGLIGSRVFGALIGTVFMGVQTWTSSVSVFRRNINWQDMISLASRYKKFPLYSVWAAILNGISWQLPTFMLSAFFSTSVVGFYALGTQTVRMPLDWLGGAIAKVFFQRAAEAQLEGNIALVVEGVFSRLVSLGMLPMVLLTMVGRDAFSLVFGGNWAEAGVYAQILAAWTFFWFISSPLGAVFSVLEKQETLLRINFAIIGTRLISLVAGGLLNDVRLALLFFGGTGVIVYGYLGIIILSEAGVAWSTSGKILLSNFLTSLPAIALIAILRLFNVPSEVVLLITGLLLLAFLAYHLMKDHQLRAGLLNTLKGRSQRDS